LLARVHHDNGEKGPGAIAGDLWASLERRRIVRNSPKIRDVVDPDILVVGLSATCNARCVHCASQCSPFRKEVLTREELTAIFGDARGTGFRGLEYGDGEPLLRPPLLYWSIHESQNYGLKTSSVLTNAFWATSPEVANHVVGEFYDTVGDQLQASQACPVKFSADPFHREFVPLENVGHGINALMGVSDGGLVIPVKTFITREETPPELAGKLIEMIYPESDADNRRLREACRIREVSPEEIEVALADERTVLKIEAGDFWRVGRASELPKSYFHQAPLSETLTPEKNSPLEDQRGSKSIHTLYVCWDGKIYPSQFYRMNNACLLGHIHQGGLQSAKDFADRDKVTAALCDSEQGLRLLHERAKRHDSGLEDLFEKTKSPFEFLAVLMQNPRLHLAITKDLHSSA